MTSGVGSDKCSVPTRGVLTVTDRNLFSSIRTPGIDSKEYRRPLNRSDVSLIVNQVKGVIGNPSGVSVGDILYDGFQGLT